MTQPIPRHPDPGNTGTDALDDVVREHMLLLRRAVHGLGAYRRPEALDRSAVLLLARLEAQGPMTMAELAAAFGLDVSTLQRQIGAAQRAGLVERFRDPAGGQARLHRATDAGRAALEGELAARRAAVAEVTRSWPAPDVAALARLLRRFNEGSEELREQPWPRERPEAPGAAAVPAGTARLRFREMTEADLDVLAGLLGDPEVMEFYPAPKTRAEVADWIAWNRRSYAEHGHGLWIVETHAGAFVGECGLTWQRVNGERRLEVGYHVAPVLQGRGYATEAAAACRDHARDVLGAPELVAIVHPENTASRRVAEKIGMEVLEEDRTGVDASYLEAIGAEARTVLGMRLT